MFDDAPSQRARVLHWAGQRLRRNAARHAMGRAFLVSACVVAAAFVVLRAFTNLDPSPAWLLVPFACALVAFAIGHRTGKPDVMPLAIAVDRRFALRELTSTALHLEGVSREHASHAVLDTIQQQMLERLRTLTMQSVRDAFPPRRTRHAWWGALALALAFALTGFIEPPRPVGGPRPSSEVATSEERQQVREAARGLERRAAELERALEVRQLERARLAARQVREAARRMSEESKGLGDTLARLSQLQSDLDRVREETFGTKRTATFREREECFERLRDLAESLERSDLAATDEALQSFAQALAAEAAAARAEGRSPIVDADALDRLRERLEREAAELDALEQLLAEHPELARRLQDALDGLQQGLERQREALDYMKQRSEELTSEQLEELLRDLENLSAEDLEALLDALQECESLGALDDMLSECKGGLQGKKTGKRSASLQALLARLSRAAGRVPGQGEPGRTPGVGRGGRTGREDTSDPNTQDERIPGRVDPTGQLGPRVPFRGIPRANEAHETYTGLLRRAIDAAESSLDREEIPAAVRPYVRRYFESLKHDSEKGK